MADKWLFRAKFLVMANEEASDCDLARSHMTNNLKDGSEAQRYALGLYKKVLEQFKTLDQSWESGKRPEDGTRAALGRRGGT